jgi:hypothetical protein
MSFQHLQSIFAAVAIELPSSEPSIELIAHATMDPAGASFTCRMRVTLVTCNHSMQEKKGIKGNEKFNGPISTLCPVSSPSGLFTNIDQKITSFAVASCKKRPINRKIRSK